MYVSPVQSGTSLPVPTSPPPSAGANTGSFSASLEAAQASPIESLRASEQLVGTVIQAPPGGCGCDALAAAAGATVDPAKVTSASRRAEPGDLLVLRDGEEAASRLHLAVARSMLEMIAVGRDGVVRVEPIPFDRLIGLAG